MNTACKIIAGFLIFGCIASSSAASFGAPACALKIKCMNYNKNCSCSVSYSYFTKSPIASCGSGVVIMNKMTPTYLTNHHLNWGGATCHPTVTCGPGVWLKLSQPPQLQGAYLCT